MGIPYLYRPREIVVSGGERSGLNAGVSTITAGHFVTGEENSISIPSASTAPIFGVTRKDVPAGTRGSLNSMGRAILIVGATPVTAGQQVMPEANTGCAIPYVASAGNACGGLAATGGSSGQEIEVDLGLGMPSV